MKIKQITVLAVFVALAIVVRFFSFPIIPQATFLKLEISDVFVGLATFYLGWKGLYISSILKAIIVYMLNPDIIGAVAHFMSSMIFVGAFYVLYKHMQNRVLVSLFATIIFAVCLSVLNYSVFLPLYTQLYRMNMGPLETVVLWAVLPFNVIKGLVLSSVLMLVLKTAVLKRFFDQTAN